MKRCVAVLLLLLFLAPVCRGQEMWDALGLDDLSRAAEQYDTVVGLSADTDLDGGLARLWERVERYLPQTVRAGVKGALALLLVVLLCAMAEGLRTAGQEQSGMNVCVMAGALAIAALSANDMNAMMGLGRATLERMEGFSKVLLPVTAACAAAAGSAAGAAARQLATAMFSGLLISLIDGLLVPLVYAYLAVSTAYAAVGNPGLKKVAGALKWVVTRSLSALLVLFVTYLTISGAVAGTTDAATLKAAKLVIATLVPVVGGIISNTAQTVLAGAALLKNTVGVFGMLAVLGICIVPFLRLGVQYLAYKFCGTLASVLADSRLGELIENIGTAFALVLGMTGASALLLLVSILSSLSGGGG